MKLFQRFIFLALLIFSIQIVFAQGKDYYVQLDYLKVPVETDAVFNDIQKDVWKPVHMDRLRQKEIVSWRLYKVRYPSGDNTEYNYVEMTIFAKFENLDEPFEDMATIVERVHPGKALDDLNRDMLDTRKLVKSEAFRSIEMVNNPNYEKPSPHLLMDYMKVSPNQIDDYVKIETEIWKPIHQYRVDKGLLGGWSLLFMQFPGGTNYPYTYATANYYDDWSKVQDSYPEDIWSIVHPKADSEGLNEMTNETRDLVSSQIWRLLDYAEGTPTYK